jgi:hypothetical protein
MSGNLRDILRRYFDSMPDDEGLAAREELPKGPNPVTYPGRPNWCGGALTREKGADGEWQDKRQKCGEECGPGQTLCHRCAELEWRERKKRADKKTEAQQTQQAKDVATTQGVIIRKPRGGVQR